MRTLHALLALLAAFVAMAHADNSVCFQEHKGECISGIKCVARFGKRQSDRKTACPDSGWGTVCCRSTKTVERFENAQLHRVLDTVPIERPPANFHDVRGDETWSPTHGMAEERPINGRPHFDLDMRYQPTPTPSPYMHMGSQPAVEDDFSIDSLAAKGAKVLFSMTGVELPTIDHVSSEIVDQIKASEFGLGSLDGEKFQYYRTVIDGALQTFQLVFRQELHNGGEYALVSVIRKIADRDALVATADDIFTSTKDTMRVRFNDGVKILLQPISNNGMLLKMADDPRAAPAILWRDIKAVASNKLDGYVESTREFLQLYALKHEQMLAGEVNEFLGEFRHHPLFKNLRSVDDVRAIFGNTKLAIDYMIKLAESEAKERLKNTATRLLDDTLAKALPGVLGAIQETKESIDYWHDRIVEARDTVARIPEVLPRSVADRLLSETNNALQRLESRLRLSENRVEMDAMAREEINRAAKDSARQLLEYVKTEFDAKASSAVQTALANLFEDTQNEQQFSLMGEIENPGDDPLMATLDSDVTVDRLAEVLLLTIENSPKLVKGINEGMDWYRGVIDRLTFAGHRIGDYLEGLMRERAIPLILYKSIEKKGGVMPGEKEILVSLYLRSSEAAHKRFLQIRNEINPLAKELGSQASRLLYASEAGLPDSLERAADAVLDLPAFFKSFDTLDFRAYLRIEREHMKAILDVSVVVHDVNDATKAKAEVQARFEAARKYGNGGVLKTGVLVTATVAGVLTEPELKAAVVDWFVTYENTEAGVTSGIYGSLAVPVRNAIARTDGQEGMRLEKLNVEGSVAGSLLWKVNKRLSFRVYGGVDLDTTRDTALQWKTGLEMTYDVTDSATLKLGIYASDDMMRDRGARLDPLWSSENVEIGAGFEWRF